MKKLLIAILLIPIIALAQETKKPTMPIVYIEEKIHNAKNGATIRFERGIYWGTLTLQN